MAVETSLEAKAQEVAPQSEHGDIAQKTRDDSGKFLPSESRVDNMNSGKTKGGTSQEYLLGRIKRDPQTVAAIAGAWQEGQHTSSLKRLKSLKMCAMAHKLSPRMKGKLDLLPNYPQNISKRLTFC
ncbi:hypothetical protein AVDCRST_MAG81-846 [uncultured Synechococcales cyanobacterium]|uniref:Uncharacterized protein n=1 Tax=uncultured Synechococcales cyanobacterium TaxID=1936017 RepID=A0A6J4UYN1_9CYAN|nr:hypothetical protein AVDCRST_MAG81-846 [uncultured Synechococcales cyanobacterium]